MYFLCKLSGRIIFFGVGKPSCLYVWRCAFLIRFFSLINMVAAAGNFGGGEGCDLI